MSIGAFRSFTIASTRVVSWQSSFRPALDEPQYEAFATYFDCGAPHRFAAPWAALSGEFDASLAHSYYKFFDSGAELRTLKAQDSAEAGFPDRSTHTRA